MQLCVTPHVNVIIGTSPVTAGVVPGLYVVLCVPESARDHAPDPVLPDALHPAQDHTPVRVTVGAGEVTGLDLIRFDLNI